MADIAVLPDFTVAVYTRADKPVILPAGLALRPTRWGEDVVGGYDTATIEAQGPEAALNALGGWLRYGVEIRGAGGLLWEGRIGEISLRLGNATVTLSTERMFNAVNVIYSYTADDGGGETGVTGWLVDDAAAAEYGRKEALHSAGGEMTEDQALALRRTVLNACLGAGRLPDVMLDGAGDEYGATLHCVGAFQDLDWRYYEDAGGYESHEETGGGRVLLGWGYTANTIGFVSAPNNRILDWGGKLGALDEGDQVKVSGSAGNNGAKVVAAPVDGDPQTYTAGTISFDPTDDIKDSAQGLGFVRAKEGIRVTGSPNNDGYYFVGEVTASDRVEASAGYGALPIQSDSAGPNVTIAMAHNVETKTALAHELPGATVTLMAYGQQVAQGFQVTNGPWQAGEAAVHIAKHGAPADDLVVEIRADNGGLPGVVIASGLLDSDNVPPKTRAWRSVQMVTPVTLTNGVPYWINVKRLGAADPDNYYSLSIDTDATYTRGSLRLWDGGAWQTRAAAAHMPFRVWGTLDTTEKIREIVQACGGGVRDAYAQTPAGVRTRKGRDGRSTAGDEVRQLMKMGDSLGRRMFGIVREGGTLAIDYETAAGTAPMLWREDGKIRRADGGLLPNGVLPVGRWVQVEQFLVGSQPVQGGAFLVGHAEYDAEQGAWSLRRLDTRDPFDIGAQQG